MATELKESQINSRSNSQLRIQIGEASTQSHQQASNKASQIPGPPGITLPQKIIIKMKERKKDQQLKMQGMQSKAIKNSMIAEVANF